MYFVRYNKMKTTSSHTQVEAKKGNITLYLFKGLGFLGVGWGGKADRIPFHAALYGTFQETESVE